MTAIPANVTVANVTGKYSMNKTISDSSEETLKIQSVGWLVRKVAANSAISITMKDYTDKGVRRIDLDQTSTGGMKNAEDRWLDYTWKEKDDKIWGKVKGRAKASTLAEVKAEVDDQFLLEGFEGDEVIWQQIESVADGWNTVQTWGFGEVEGVRRHVRKVVTTKGAQVARIRLVYDWEA